MKTAIKCRCCGKMFRPANSKVKICSDECRLMMKRRCAVNAVRRYRAKGAITTKTCPNCAQAKRLLEEAGIRYEQVLAEDHPDMVRELGIRQAPTLVLNNDRNQKKIGVGAIRNYILEKQ